MSSYLHVMLMKQPAHGIISQLEWENKAAIDLGIEWRTKIFCLNDMGINSYGDIFVSSTVAKHISYKNIFSRVIQWATFRFEYIFWLILQFKKYDHILVRYMPADPIFFIFILFFGKKIYTVHHTVEGHELRQYPGFHNKLRYYLERYFGGIFMSRCLGSIGVTQEIVDYEASRTIGSKKKYTIYPNGIYLNERQIIGSIQTLHYPQFVFTASDFYTWHGVDCLLESLTSCTSNFVLHLIGKLSEEDYCLASTDSRVIVHGSLSVNEINEIYAVCDVGISSFALHKKSMNEACTLKVREYFSAGLLVYSGHKDVFPEGFSFYRVGPPIINNLIKYSNSFKGLERSAIRDSAASYIDKKEILKRLHDWLEGGSKC